MTEQEEIRHLKLTMLEAAHQLGSLSMGVEGALRARVCSVANRLNYALGRGLSSHGDQPCVKCGVFKSGDEKCPACWGRE